MKKQIYEGLKVRVQLVREGSAKEYHKHISCSGDVIEFVGDRLSSMDREYFLSILMNGRHVPIGVEEVSIGAQNASIICPRELFRAALLSSAAALILVHNHPSGHSDPSPEDHKITERIKKSSDLIGIKILDHIIIGHGNHFSFADEGLI
ncbi:RadC family protein [Thermodesulfobacteriota bacterium]